MIELMQGDNRSKLRQMAQEGRFVHSVCTDPPYGLTSVVKRFGGQNAKPAQFGTDGLFQRQSGGMMNKKWDGTGIERNPDFWRLVYDVMLPGAYIIAFSSTRTYHHMAVAMEEAGFITHPMFIWAFFTGFPKGHNPHVEGFEGWKTGTQSLKPALEPVYFGQKPFSEKTGALNIMRHGVGAVNIDACRVPLGDDKPYSYPNGRGGTGWQGIGSLSANLDVPLDGNSGGRYPANLVHDGSPEVVALFPQSAGQQGEIRGTEPSRTGDENTHCYGEYGPRPPTPVRGDSGSAARFFNSFPHEGPIMCSPKAGKKDRAGSKHATVKPIGLMQHFIRLITPPGGLVLDPFAGTGTTGQAALNEGMRCVLMEAEPEYARDIRRRFGLPETVSDKLVNLSEAFG